MTFATVIVGDAPQALVAELDRDLAAAPLSPFREEQIVVQSLGMERWVSNELAVRQGCVASVAFPFPAAFCQKVARDLYRADPSHPTELLAPGFDAAALSWRLFELLDDAALLADPACAPLRRYLTDAAAPKRFGLARRIANQFDDYQLYRSDVLLAWEEGAVPADASAHERCQAFLWQRLTAGARTNHLARWFTRTIERLETTPHAPAGLPDRVSVFGVSTLPPLFIRLLHAVARFVPVRYYVLAPDPALAAADRMHPLFRAFGGASRELLSLLSDRADSPAVQVVRHETPARPSLLATVQRDIRQGVLRRASSGDAAPVERHAADRSLTVHVCHSPVREMEVLYNQLMDAFASDPSLRPHDVLVMVPDVATYAPLAASVFDGAGTPGTRLPHRIADRALALDVTPARALLQLLALVGARGTATEVLNLLHTDCVARAAQVPVSSLDRVAALIEAAGIRWGFDGNTRRERFDLPAVENNTWRRGLDRLLMGYATGRVDSLVSDLLPVAGDTIGDAELLGAFCVWVESLFAMLEELRTPRSLGAWSDRLQQVLEWLVEPADADERAQLDQLARDMRALGSAHGTSADDEPVPFDVVHRWVEETLSAEQYASGFMRGGITVAAIKPMRAIPFRIIAMLGLDDAAFPRSTRRAAFDLLDIAPRAGDRDGRADDRQLLLDTLLCAGDRLILSYVGRSQKNNADLAPSVVISELLNELEASARNGGVTAAASIVVEHPLQPFSPRYFDGSDPRLFSYNTTIASSAGQRRVEAPPFVPRSVAVADATAGTAPLTLTIEDLVACWQNPARLFCTQTLRMRFPRDEEATADAEPMGIDALQRVVLQQQSLERHLAGNVDSAQAAEMLLASGTLPSGALGPVWRQTLERDLGSMLRQIGTPSFLDPLPCVVAGDGWTLTGTIDGRESGGRLQARAATIKPKDLVRAWVTHVALCAMQPASVTRLMGIERTVVFAPVPDAEGVLQTLVAGYRRALQAPLPYALGAGEAYWKAMASDRQRDFAFHRAASAFDGDEFTTGDREDPAVALCWRGRDLITECREDFAAITTTFWSPLTMSRTAAQADGEHSGEDEG